MSFFYEFLNSFNVLDMKKEVAISVLVGKGFSVLGDVKLLDFSSELIEFGLKNKKIVFGGKDMFVKTMSKGEFVVFGNVCKIDIGE